jgi:hypothetical protein
MTTLFNYDPYNDDFDEDKNFMRVLFRPGYSLQARELTQLQTILSNQIERFGNHIFQSGSPVVGGKISLDDRGFYAVLNPQYSGEDIVLDNFINKTVISYNSLKSVRAKVVSVDNTTGVPILIMKYLSGEFFEESDEIKVVGENTFAQLRSTSAVGRSYLASINDGIYYFKGQFVKVLPQFLVLETFYRIGYNAATTNVEPSYKIGIQFEEQVIDEVDDSSLLDPAQGSFNYQAPGATRFKIATTLSKRTLDSADESSFFEVIRIVDGVKTKEVVQPIYGEIEKLLARRTYEESGNYTVDPFVMSLEEENSNPDSFTAVLDPGKAYVGGHEIQTIASTKLTVGRGRETSYVSDYDLPTNYSSYVVANTVSGSLVISDFPILDIHSVPYDKIRTSTDNEYNTTKIGTMRANMIKYNDSTASDDGSTHTFTVNLFDSKTSVISGTLPSVGSNTQYIDLPSDFSDAVGEGAFAGMFFKITDGAGVNLAPIRVAGSAGSNVWLSSALSFTPQSNTFALQADFKVAESIVKRNGAALTFAANIDGDSKDSDGNAFITEPNRQNLVFDVPFSALKANSITNFDFYARKVYSNKISDAGGVITLSTSGTDTFAFAGSPGTLSDTTILNNILCFVRYDSTSNGTSGITPNTVLSLANNLFTVTAIDNTTLEIDLNTAGVRADFIVTTKVNNAEDGTNGAIRSKKMYPLTADKQEKVAYDLGGAGTLTSANTGIVTPFTGGYVFPDLGVTFFNLDDGVQGTVTKLKTPGVSVSLQVPDVYNIVKIVDSKSNTSNVTTAMLSDPAHDVTDRYELDNGQRTTHYDHATIKLKRGYSSPTGSSIYVMYNYMRHGSAPSPQNIGLFTVDSYLSGDSNISYDNISMFFDKKNSRLLSNRASFDYRPTRAIAGDTLTGSVCPDPDQTAEVSFQHYLGRVDKIVVKPSKELAVVSGISAIKPVPPVIKPEDMLIYTLYIPPYTESVKDVRSDFENNRRFTMRDIGAFENRIKGLEYYVALNSLEKNANDSKILDNNGLERAKYGILVDNFTSTDVQSTYSDVGFDNRCLIEDSALKPASLMRTVKMKWNKTSSSGNYRAVGIGDKKSLLLDYTNTPFAVQPYATKTQTVAGALYAHFHGMVRLWPEFTSDQDTGVTAKVNLNANQGLENAFNFVNDAFKFISDQNPTWVNDADNPFAKIVDSKWFETVTTVTNSEVNLSGFRNRGNLQTTTDSVYISKNAELYQRQIDVNTTQVDLGSFVTDVSINPYLKPRDIAFKGASLRPKTRFYAYFDDVPVDNFCLIPDLITTTTSTAGFRSGEYAIIANSASEISTSLSQYINGTALVDLVTITSVDSSGLIRVVNETGKSLNGKYILGLDSSISEVITGITDHRTGVTRSITSSTITLGSEAPSVNISGNTISLVRTTSSDSGYGQQYTITSYNTATKEATISGTTTVAERSGQFVYTIGVNKTNSFGDISGVFYPPPATFRTGERNFRLTESFNNSYDLDAISFGEKTYVSSGVTINKTNLVDTVYNISPVVKLVGSATSPILQSTSTDSKITRTWHRCMDPLAQTFYVDEQAYPFGLYLQSVGLFFSAKDDELPLCIQIRPTVNGLPSSDFWFPESVVHKKPQEVIVTSNPSVDVASTQTTFTFGSPVFLKPGLYAVVVMSETPDYALWTAEKGQRTLTNEYVSVNPYVGTLYKSQNTMEYVPYLNEDVMFVLNRCKFNINSTAQFSLQSEAQTTAKYYDKFRLLETSIQNLSNSPVTIDYSFVSKPVGGTKETTYRQITPQVTYFLSDDNQYIVGNKRKELLNQGDFTALLTMSTNDDTVSPLVSLESVYLNAWENFIDDAEINVEDFNIIVPGSGYSNSNTVTVTSTSGTGALIYLVTDGVNGNVVGLNVSSSGTGYIDNFTISIPDTTDPSGNITSNAVVVLNSEYDSTGGPCLARYITKPITLADGFDAGDLRVFLSANKPSGTEIHVFYKILSDSDSIDFKETAYQKLECFNPTVSPSIDKSYREYEYRPSLTTDSISYVSENGITYDNFKTFSIKIVMTSQDTSVVPTVKDLRIIALPAG